MGGDPAATPSSGPGRLDGKVVLVTGASRGIGEAVARRCAAVGAAVAVSARTVDEGDHPLPGSVTTTVRSIAEAGGRALAVAADLSRPDDRAALLDRVTRELGPVDVLVNNAAVTFFEPAAAFNALAPTGLVATPGVEHHGLTRGVPDELVEQPDEFAEAALWLCTGDPTERTGRIAYSRQLQAEIADLVDQ